MSAGYSSTPLYKKLGIKEGFKVKLINPPANYNKLLGDIVKQTTITTKKEQVNFIHLFTNSVKELESKLPIFKNEIEKDGMIWVSWYKNSAKKPTELDENIVRDTALALGLVDVKVCAVDDKMVGLKACLQVEGSVNFHYKLKGIQGVVNNYLTFYLLMEILSLNLLYTPRLYQRRI